MIMFGKLIREPDLSSEHNFRLQVCSIEEGHFSHLFLFHNRSRRSFSSADIAKVKNLIAGSLYAEFLNTKQVNILIKFQYSSSD